MSKYFKLFSPKFYEQTLHLMNKMNLPCPLHPYIPESSSIQINKIKIRTSLHARAKLNVIPKQN